MGRSAPCLSSVRRVGVGKLILLPLLIDTREARVTDWRSFQKGETSGKKKKKQKLEVLG